MHGRELVADRAAPGAAHGRGIGAALLGVVALVYVYANRREVPKMWRILTTRVALVTLLLLVMQS